MSESKTKQPVVVGRCRCGGEMLCKSPRHPKANVRCAACGATMYLDNWKRHYGGPAARCGLVACLNLPLLGDWSVWRGMGSMRPNGGGLTGRGPTGESKGAS